jgi:hypothetical protein
MLDSPAIGGAGVDWFPAWSYLGAARRLNLSDDQFLVPVRLADEWWSAQMFADCGVAFAAASLVLAVSLPMAQQARAGCVGASWSQHV